MSVASSLEAALDALAKQGFKTVKRQGWQSRKARKDIAFDNPKGVIFHHTGGWGTSDSMLYATGNGRVGAPLCHLSIDQKGVITLGAAGYANHAGINNKAAVAKILAGPDAEIKPGADTAGYSANRYTVGVEVKCPAGYNAAQRQVAVALAAELVKAFGWSKTKIPVGAHKEITRRKPGDPGDNMQIFRNDVRALLTVQPDTIPAPAKETEITLLIANCQSYDGTKTLAAWNARADIAAKYKADAILACETSDPGRKAMCARLGAGWRYYSNGKSVAILAGPRAKTAGLKRVASFGTAFGHGAVLMPFRFDGVGVDLISHHTRPGDVATNAQKDADIAKGAKLAGTWPAVLGGDFARNNPVIKGWRRATPVVDTMDKGGVQSPDAAYIKGQVVVVSTKLIDPKGLSDHKWWLVVVKVVN